MLYEYLARQIALEFEHTFTPGQAAAVLHIARFLMEQRPMQAFVLRGYAGTGKTSVVGAVVRTLQRMERPVVLLAPTGRAAKVFARHAGVPAHTIHKAIYRQNAFQGEGTRFSLNYNKLRSALFIVDEASMLQAGSGGPSLFGSGSLLDDLIRFVYDGEDCRLLLVGDTAQLPPVGEQESPALRPEVLVRYGLEVGQAELTEVVRQAADSDVLSAATRLRLQLTLGLTGGQSALLTQLPRVCGRELSDRRESQVRFVPGDELIESLISSYDQWGTSGVVVVTRSNKRANVYNQGIRSRVFDREDELVRGDLVMAVKNNYYWAERQYLEACDAAKQEGAPLPPRHADFIANGDVAEVVRLRGVHEQHGLRFADATLRFPDYDDLELHCRVLLSTLQSDSPSLTPDESQQLYERVLADYADLPTKRERMRAVREDPYYNALQLKYAYAVTCHKAQGGQWEHVYVDQGWLPPDALGQSYLRWLYTAFTRATERLLLVNWPEQQRDADPPARA